MVHKRGALRNQFGSIATTEVVDRTVCGASVAAIPRHFIPRAGSQNEFHVPALAYFGLFFNRLSCIRCGSATGRGYFAPLAFQCTSAPLFRA
jgi:hypothetical protein